MFKLNTKFNTDLFLNLLSRFECDGHTVQMLTQQHLPPPLTSTVKSSLFNIHIPVHSSWLPGDIDSLQTILVILTKVGLFQERHHISDKILLQAMSKILLPMFSSRIFMVWGLTFKSLIHF